MNRPTIGVHLIIRNEAALLPACFQSVAGADELIVVDTGSEDYSIAVAEAYGARVLQYKWEDDFAKARNTGLAHATADWILVLDADEVLEHSAGKNTAAADRRYSRGFYRQHRQFARPPGRRTPAPPGCTPVPGWTGLPLFRQNPRGYRSGNYQQARHFSDRT